jgi:hypothetical protein
MRDWAMVWRKHGWPLALEHAIQNRNFARCAANHATEGRAQSKPGPDAARIAEAPKNGTAE